MEIHTKDQIFKLVDANPDSISKALNNRKFVHGVGIGGTYFWIKVEDIIYVSQGGK